MHPKVRVRPVIFDYIHLGRSLEGRVRELDLRGRSDSALFCPHCKMFPRDIIAVFVLSETFYRRKEVVIGSRLPREAEILVS